VGGSPTFFFRMQGVIQDIVRQVEALATPVMVEEGHELWGVDLRQELGRWVLRLALEREGGVSLDDLTRVHRQLGDLFDAHDVVPWRYVLEVSSPGINRPLLRVSHYQRSVGKRVRVQTRTLLYEGRRVFTGILTETADTGIVVVDESVGRVEIGWDDIVKAAIAHEFPSPGNKKKGAQR
jgi:ribosome maturation factor RimP